MRDKEFREDDKMTRQGGIGDLGLGLELRRLREEGGMSLEYVAGALGWSMSKLSRLERGGKGAEATPEEVSALLGTMRVIGEDRARVMRLATGKSEQGWWEGHDPNASDQVRTYLTFERKAKKIVNVQSQLVPGLLQTADYCRTVFTGVGVHESKIRARMAHRLGRQALLDFHTAPEFVFIMCELMLRQPFGSELLMAQQIRHIISEAKRPHVTVLIVPQSVVAHPGLMGGFILLEFEDQPTVVYIEGRMSGMFPENPLEVAEYKMAAELQASLALDEQRSNELLVTIAEDLEKVRAQ